MLWAVAVPFVHFLDGGDPRELVEQRVEHGVLETTVLREIHRSIPSLFIRSPAHILGLALVDSVIDSLFITAHSEFDGVDDIGRDVGANAHHPPVHHFDFISEGSAQLDGAENNGEDGLGRGGENIFPRARGGEAFVQMRVQVSDIVPDLRGGDRGPLPEAGARTKVRLLPRGVVAGPLRVPEELQDSDQIDGSIDHRGANQKDFFPSLIRVPPRDR